MHLEEYIKDNFNNKSIAVIGNADIKKEYGKDIDAHDIIIRINHFRLNRKYKPFTGTKVTHWCIHSGEGMRNRHSFKEALCPFPGRDNKYPYTVITPEKDWREISGIPRMTTGGTFLFILISLSIPVDAYGFDFLKTGHYFNKKHKHKQVHLDGIDEEEKLLLNSPVRFNF